MTLLPPGHERVLEPLFPNPQDTTIWSYLQGRFGQGWVDSLEQPTCARIIVGDFCFFGGDAMAEGALEMVRDFPQERHNQWILAIPPDGVWAARFEVANPGRHNKIQRYAIKKEPACFDRQKLTALVDALPAGYTLTQMDTALCRKCAEQDFSKDFCSNFASPEDFIRRGVGYVALWQGEIAAGASSYTSYDAGVEIEIATHPDHRRKGLATVCGAALILHCLDHGLYPAWDAANLESVALAEKLGYHLDHPYDTYVIFWGNPSGQ